MKHFHIQSLQLQLHYNMQCLEVLNNNINPNSKSSKTYPDPKAKTDFNHQRIFGKRKKMGETEN